MVPVLGVACFGYIINEKAAEKIEQYKQAKPNQPKFATHEAEKTGERKKLAILAILVTTIVLTALLAPLAYLMAFSVKAKLIYMAASTVVIASASAFPHRERFESLSGQRKL